MYKIEKHAEEKSQWIDHTHQVIIITKQFLSALQNTEIGQRGYLLTEKLDYLEPYQIGIHDAFENYNLLYKKTWDNKNQTERLEKIKILMEKKFEELKLTISLNQNGNRIQAINFVKNDTGKLLMDEIRSIIKDFTHEEEVLLKKRQDDFVSERSKLNTFIIVGMSFFTFMAVLTFLFLNTTLFHTMELLLKNTHKMEDGKKIDIKDVTSQDEMGYLLSSFYKMNEKVLEREKKLSYIAHHDELTGLQNRVNVYDYINKVIKKAKKENSKVSVLFLDLNKFKEVNDTFGHEAGDILLKESAVRFNNVIRTSDTIFRLGGDEFLIVIENIQNEEIVERIINNMFEIIKTPVMYKDIKMKISVSVGISFYPKDATTPDGLIKYSDIAMYMAKKDEKKHYKYFNTSMLPK